MCPEDVPVAGQSQSDDKASREVHKITANLCCECLGNTMVLEPGDDVRGSETKTSMEHKQEVDRTRFGTAHWFLLQPVTMVP